MAATIPTTTIDTLPSKTTPAGTELMIIQDAGVTKQITVSHLTSVPSAPLTAHLANATDAHDATAISTTDSGGGINGVNVQAQLGQLASISLNITETLQELADLVIRVNDLEARLDAVEAG